jgi:hypothetical protein
MDKLFVEDVMGRLFMVLVVLVIGIACIGFYLGWFNLASDSKDGKSHITLTVDKDRIHESEKAAVEKVQGLTNSAKDTTGGTNEKSKD